jgi:hypothetical protein
MYQLGNDVRMVGEEPMYEYQLGTSEGIGFCWTFEFRDCQSSARAI